MRGFMHRLVLPLACALLVATGCEQPGKVSGLVTLDGEPLTTGVITFNPEGGGPTSYGAIGVDGRYELQTGGEKGLKAGQYVVTIAANAAAPAAALERPEADGPAPGPQVLPLLTPAKYNDVGQSPLRATIKGGEQTLEFHLTSDGEAVPAGRDGTEGNADAATTAGSER